LSSQGEKKANDQCPLLYDLHCLRKGKKMGGKIQRTPERKALLSLRYRKEKLKRMLVEGIVHGYETGGHGKGRGGLTKGTSHEQLNGPSQSVAETFCQVYCPELGKWPYRKGG